MMYDRYACFSSIDTIVFPGASPNSLPSVHSLLEQNTVQQRSIRIFGGNFAKKKYAKIDFVVPVLKIKKRDLFC